VSVPTDSSVLAKDTQGVADPGLAINLSPVQDWSSQMPFIDVFKQSRLFQSERLLPNSTRVSMNYEDLAAEGILDENGWPTQIPDGMDYVFATLAWTQEEAQSYRSGRYVIEWEGTGEVVLWGGTVVNQTNNRLVVEIEDIRNYRIRIDETDPQGTGDYVRDITMVKQEHLALHRAGAVFNPDWVELIEDMRSLRFMDWMDTNNSTQSEWDGRPKESDAQWSGEGVPLEVMVDLANQTGTDPWFTIPYHATDEYIREFATYVRDNLDPDLKAMVEYSNEVWNFSFQQAKDSFSEATEELDAQIGSGWLQNYGMNAANVADIWSDVFSDQAQDRLVNILATQTATPGRADPILEAPDYAALDPDFEAPHLSFDAWAVTGYFNGLTETIQNQTKIPLVKEWIAESIARSTGEDDRYDYAIDLAIQEIRDGSVTGDPRAGLAHLKTLFEEQAAIAESYGLDLVMYEGGTHVVGLGRDVNDQELTDFFTTLNASDAMGEIYAEVLVMWEDVGGQAFNAFNDVLVNGKFGSWGALQSLDDSSARWDILTAHNEARQGDWEERNEGAFDQGITVYGRRWDDTLTGTLEEDFLIGRKGDDILFGAAGDDGLNGGPGDDILVGGSGDDIYFGGQGADTFVITKGEDADIIDDFKVGKDSLDLSDLGVSWDEFSSGLVEISNVKGGVALEFQMGNSLMFAGLSASDLSQDDMIFSDLEAPDDTLVVQADQGMRIAAVNPFSNTGKEIAATMADNGQSGTAYYTTTHKDGATYAQANSGGVAAGEEAGVEYFSGVSSFVATEFADQFFGRNEQVSVTMGDGNDYVLASSEDDVIVGGGGDDRLWGKEGSDVFVFAQGDGDDVINDFETGSDLLDLSVFEFSENALENGEISISHVNDAAVLSFGDVSVTLANIGDSDLSNSDFIL